MLILYHTKCNLSKQIKYFDDIRQKNADTAQYPHFSQKTVRVVALLKTCFQCIVKRIKDLNHIIGFISDISAFSPAVNEHIQGIIGNIRINIQFSDKILYTVRKCDSSAESIIHDKAF